MICQFKVDTKRHASEMLKARKRLKQFLAPIAYTDLNKSVAKAIGKAFANRFTQSEAINPAPTFRLPFTLGEALNEIANEQNKDRRAILTGLLSEEVFPVAEYIAPKGRQ